MGKKAIHFKVTVKGKEVVIKRCTGCGKDKALSDYSKGVALFGRQAKCKECNKEEYAAMKAYIDEVQFVNIRVIEDMLPYVKYTGHTRKEADMFIYAFYDLALDTFEENLKQLNKLY